MELVSDLICYQPARIATDFLTWLEGLKSTSEEKLRKQTKNRQGTDKLKGPTELPLSRQEIVSHLVNSVLYESICVFSKWLSVHDRTINCV